MTDPFPQLSVYIDIGGDRYVMDGSKSIEFAYKSRADFKKVYGDLSDTERLLRMYFPLDGNYHKLIFEKPEDKTDLIMILEKRTVNIKRSNEFSSSLIKNLVVQKIYSKLQDILKVLRGPDYEPVNVIGPILGKLADLIPIGKDKKYVEALSDDAKFNLILELSWYLLHPDKVPKDAQKQWFTLVRKLDTMRVGDIVEEIKKGEIQSDIESLFDYFSRIDIGKISRTDSLENALEAAVQMAKKIDVQNTRERLIDRLTLILKILESKKYLSEAQKQSILDVTQEPNTSSLYTIPLSQKKIGGAILAEGLKGALSPYFDFFEEAYGPFYTFPGISAESLRSFITLLYIVNHVDSGEGVYRISGVETDVIQSLKDKIVLEKEFIYNMENPEEFYEKKKLLPTIEVAGKDEMPAPLKEKYSTLRALFVGGETISISGISIKHILSNSAASHTTSPRFDKTLESLDISELSSGIQSFFKKDELYLVVCRNDDKIPMNLYEIEFEEVRINFPIEVIKKEGYFSEMSINSEPFYLNDILSIDIPTGITSAELSFGILNIYSKKI